MPLDATPKRSALIGPIVTRGQERTFQKMHARDPRLSPPDHFPLPPRLHKPAVCVQPPIWPSPLRASRSFSRYSSAILIFVSSQMARVCPHLQSSGTCAVESCPFNHDVIFCEPCQRIFTSARIYEAHSRGKKHLKGISGVSTSFHCPACGVNVSGMHCWEQHINGRPHRSRTEGVGASVDVQPEEAHALPGQTRCQLCDVNVNSRHWTSHVAKPSHKRREQFVAYKSAFDEASKDKHGVTISHGDSGIDFGIVELQDAEGGVRVELKIQMTSPSTRIKITGLKLASTSSSLSFRSPFAFTVPSPSVLQSSRATRVYITFQQSLRGRYQDRLEISFEDVGLGQRFIIVRALKAIVGSKADYEALKPVSPYVPRKTTRRSPETEILPGDPPPATNAIKWVVSLPEAPIPKSISSVLFAGSVSDIIAQLKRTVLPSHLNTTTYSRHLQFLIWIEENQMENDLHIYDMDDAVLDRHGIYYYLKVPGLAEKRPSVITGDSILVQRHGSDRGRWFEGRVHFVRREEVGLKFHYSFPSTERGQLYNVRFKLNRFPLRRQHQALVTAFTPERIFFPIRQHIFAKPRNTPFSLYNSNLANNAPQLDAVTSIVKSSPGSVPFIVFGPPGTGKTVTIVESILQIIHANPQARILACAPSNSAADLIASKLISLGARKLFRFYAPSRTKETVPDALLPFTCRNIDGLFSSPEMPFLRRYSVIVSTCVSASFAHGIGVPRGHFSHIFVDEAGHATEPEVMIAIKTIADLNTNIVLSGDPKQLGPIIRSAVARDLQLDISYLERLMNREIYDTKSGHGITIVKLTKNYRSHKSILRYPNERFYANELEPCADKKTTDFFLGSSLLASSKFPIIFHAMSGQDDREASSPSFFNVEETLQVKDYVVQLRADRRFRVSDHDIGIIAPYHAQCRRISKALSGVADDIKVGSVEEFQGQERKVIIISTVRSSREFVAYDLRHTLGFVANPRRFNVAVTRAQALLIVVGDPYVLSLDPLWRSFLNYVHINKGWKGVPIPWDPREPVRDSGGYDAELRELGLADMNDFTRRMESFTLENVDDVNEADANVDRPWRDVE